MCETLSRRAITSIELGIFDAIVDQKQKLSIMLETAQPHSEEYQEIVQKQISKLIGMANVSGRYLQRASINEDGEAELILNCVHEWYQKSTNIAPFEMFGFTGLAIGAIYTPEEATTTSLLGEVTNRDLFLGILTYSPQSIEEKFRTIY